MIDLPVPVQIVVVWLVTGLSAAFVGWLVLFGFFVGSLLLVVIGLLGPFAVLFLIGTSTAKACPLTAIPLRRVGWAALPDPERPRRPGHPRLRPGRPGR